MGLGRGMGAARRSHGGSPCGGANEVYMERLGWRVSGISRLADFSTDGYGVDVDVIALVA
jgi:hypothetical protein